MHIGQEPDYRVGFVETPESQSPYGVRSYAEHGVIGIPAALGMHYPQRSESSL
jgi:CO/xanthine dehydrogenase Mo-binding subunit